MMFIVKMSAMWIVLVCLIFLLQLVPGGENQQLRNEEYRFLSGCVNRDEVPSDSCQQMAPAEWIFIFDLTMFHIFEDLSRAFIAQLRIVHAIFDQMNRTMEFGPDKHQIAIFAMNVSIYHTIKDLCNHMPPASIRLPPASDFTVGQYANGAIAWMFNFATSLPSCGGRTTNMQRIVILLCNFQFNLSYAHELSILARVTFGSLPDILQQWQQNTSTAMQAYFVTVNDDSFEEVTSSGVHVTNLFNVFHTYPDYPKYGSVFVNSYYQSQFVSNTVVNDVSSWFLRCACHKSEDCSTVEASRSECYFTWSDAAGQNEVCVTDVQKRIGFRPTAPQKQRQSCSAPELRETKNCARFDDCMPSCNQHQWGHWSRCTLTSRGVGQQKRQRMQNSNSRSNFTRHCKKEESRNCTPVTEPGPVVSTVTLPDYETSEEEPETTVVVTTTTIQRSSWMPVVTSQATAKPTEKTIYGVSTEVWIAIIAAVLLIVCILLVTICCFVKKHQSSKPQFIIIGGQAGVQKSWQGSQGQSKMGSIQSYQQPPPRMGKGYRQAPSGGQSYQQPSNMGSVQSYQPPPKMGKGYRQAPSGGQSYQPSTGQYTAGGGGRPNKTAAGFRSAQPAKKKYYGGTTVGDLYRTTAGTQGKQPTKQKKGQQKIQKSGTTGYVTF